MLGLLAMFIHVRRLAMYYPSLLLCLFLPFLAPNIANAGGGQKNVMVVRNLDSLTSMQIANYYIAKRHIPPENICNIHASTAELITQAQCIEQLITPIRAFLSNPAIADKIDYIVLTKDMPLAANYGYSSGPLSVASILTCVGEPTLTQYIRNPYGPTALSPVEIAFSHQLTLEGKRLYLVTRLDAFTKEEVLEMIDRSLAASSSGSILLDAQLHSSLPPCNKILNGRIQNANTILQLKELPTIYDETTAFIGNRTNLIGYFSWGSNDSAYTSAAYKSNTFLPGSIADTFVSTSARTFFPTTSGQSLIADLITSGACGVSGYVSEPYTQFSTYPNVLFDRYSIGYNMAESFFAAMPELFWKSVVIGDPLMAPYARPPIVYVNASSLPSGSNAGLKSLSGSNDVTISLTGSDAVLSATPDISASVSKVDFYFDDKFIGTSTVAPFSVVLDTTTYAVGNHHVDVTAYENSPVATQGYAAATVAISNPVSVMSKVPDAYHSADGQGVRTVSMIVTAGAAELGGEEFYIQDANRAGGIRVISNTEVEEGDWVTVHGEMTTQSGERSIAASSVEVGKHQITPTRPIFICNRAVGGEDLCNQTKGVTNGKGLRNIGLLIKTLGKVTYVGNTNEPFFYIDDGSNLHDPSGYTGLRILCRGISKPLYGSFVSITGISSCFVFDACVAPAVKIRTIRDITVLKLPV
ncbi:MAG: TIGR03790 family protein [Armatimonadetes bacterium]|nr:TIGR03790 family protein [Armatimonadota bacterium]